MPRVTIALAVCLALAPRWAAAADAAQIAATNATAAAPPTGSAVPDRSTRAPAPAPGGSVTQAFSDVGGSAGDVGSAATDTDADADADAAAVSTDESGDEETASGTSLRALSCLEGEGGNDGDGARRGVQKRDFLKRRRFELSALGGYYAADALSSTYVYGGAAAFFPSEDFGIEALVSRNPVAFRLEQAFTSFDRERHFQSGVAWNFLGAMLWSPVHAKLRWSERHITHADLLLVAGGGHTSQETAQGVTLQFGAALKLYLTRFISLRFDARDLMMPQEILGRGRNTHNLMTVLGLCVWVPG